MEIRTISDKLVLVHVSEDELKEKGIDIGNMDINRKGFDTYALELIQKAVTEYGLDAENKVIQVAVCVDVKDIIFAISVDDGIDDIVACYEKMWALKKNNHKGIPITPLNSQKERIVLKFRSLSDAIAFAACYDIKDVNSELYKEENNGNYVLVLSMKNIQQMIKLTNFLSEFRNNDKITRSKDSRN